MRRNKRLSIKKEKEDAKTRASANKEQDLAYYVHDRVELMRQVFSTLSAKEIKAMAPECIRKLSNDEIEELCLDELLGISSKRVCAIIDGAEPPSDTSSSESDSSKSSKTEPEVLETISLDSETDASSSRASKKRHKKKHHKKAKSTAPAPAAPAAPARPADTVLELLELQARARALRAHLSHSAEAPAASPESSDEVVVKEEAPPVLEISSDEDTKPKVEQETVEKPPDPPPPPPQPAAAVATGHKKKKKKKQKTKEVEVPPAVEPQTNTVTTDNDDVVVIDEDDAEETGAAEKLPEKPTEVEKEKHTEVDTESEPDYRITVPQNIPAARKISMNKNNVVISVPNVKGNDARVASIVKNVKKLNSSVTKVKKTPKLHSKVVIPADKHEDKNTSKLNTDNLNDKAEKINNGREKENAEKTTKKTKDKNKDKTRKESTQKTSCQGGSGDQEDNYEITLQLSDSEKMDLLEDLDHKNLDKVSSSSEDSSPDSDTSDSEASSSDTSKEDVPNEDETVVNTQPFRSEAPSKVVILNVEVIKPRDPEKDHVLPIESNGEEIRSETVAETCVPEVPKESTINKSRTESQITPELLKEYSDKVKENNISSDKSIVVASIDDIPVVHEEFGPKSFEDTVAPAIVDNKANKTEMEDSVTMPTDRNLEEIKTNSTNNGLSTTAVSIAQDVNNIEKVSEIEEPSEKHTELRDNDSNFEDKEKLTTEEGELQDQSDSEVEAFEVQTEIVCISDEDEAPVKNVKQKKIKKNKKEKKAKKQKKENFREVADQNFYTQKDDEPETNKPPMTDNTDDKSPTISKVTQEHIVFNPESPVDIDAYDDDDVYEILELSDDSSCYEVDGVSVLSKEPTSEEIEALSAKIDQIERVDIVSGERIEEVETSKPVNEEETRTETIENISWKDRYLDSTKVKKVLTTANILNAMRKKNKELKKKLIESKKIEEEAPQEIVETPVEEPVQLNVEEGSIEHFNLLEGSTKYVDPVKEPVVEKVTETDPETTTVEDKPQEVLTKEMKKDAKQLLKMYKRLLKYNDMHKEKDPNKKKKTKKQKKKKDGDPVTSVASIENVPMVEK
ncbi:titin isoform X2 [Plutella xylostella]|uniref:titin isoform X2 n=1 Tax=Plutella xylostella TaxID=51655 RepID=UPI002032F068|nr:titin isoform X2 [Plutella xylostella]